MVYNDYRSNFIQLLERDGSMTIHHRNIPSLAIEIFKLIKGLSPQIMKEVFILKKNIRYGSKQIFETRNVHSVHNGTETLSHLGLKIWLLVPDDIKRINNLTEFKRKIRKWKPDKCPCRICKVYTSGV